MADWRIRSEFIRQSLKERGLEQQHLAVALGKRNEYIGQWLNGRIAAPWSALVNIADFLSLPIDMLVERVDSDGIRETRMIYGMNRARMIPNVGYISAGPENKPSISFKDNRLSHEGVLGYVRFPSDDPDAFILTVAGDSMDPVYPQGTRVMIEPHLGFRVNHVHFICDTTGGWYLKRVQWDGTNYILESFNAYKYPAIYRKPDEISTIEALGKVMWRATWYLPKD